MTSARIAGLISAIVLAALFIVVIAMAVRHEGVVVPTNGVTAGGPKDNPGGVAAFDELRNRAQIQAWPGSVMREAQDLAPVPSELPPPGRQLTELWQANRPEVSDILQQPRFREGLATIPGNERGVLEQPQGRTWREFRNSQLFFGGGIYIFGVSLLIALFLAWRGRIELTEGESGETVTRFSALERANHWMTAASFLLMALTGLIILYGISLVRPWLGANAFGDLAGFSAWSHVTLAVPFVIGILMMAVLWLRGNMPEQLDWNWLRHGGGFLRHDGEKPPARRFNAGQKIVFWGVFLGGLALLVTGLFLMFPFYWSGYVGMQTAQSLHSGLGLLMIGLIIGHIYIGTIGMQGAFEAMWSGRVDRNWAKEHHQLWYERIEAGEEGQTIQPARPRTHSAVGSLAAGTIVAVLLAVIMVGVYRQTSQGSALATTADNPAVHLDPSQLSTSARAFAERR